MTMSYTFGTMVCSALAKIPSWKVVLLPSTIATNPYTDTG
jgi:hypothetical protein